MKTADALPHEMDALNQLLKADADVQAPPDRAAAEAGAAAGATGPTPDLSTLFDQELRKQQQTNYETPNDTEARPDTTRRRTRSRGSASWPAARKRCSARSATWPAAATG